MSNAAATVVPDDLIQLDANTRKILCNRMNTTTDESKTMSKEAVVAYIN